MFRLIKWLFALVAIILALIIGLLYSKDSLARAAVEQQIRAQTGMDVKIDKLSMGLFSPIVRIDNLTLSNPADFGGIPFLHLRDVYAEYDRDALAHRELQLKLLRATVAELAVVKNDLGQTNIINLAAAPQKKSSEAVLFTGIEVANFSFEKMTYLDLKNERNNRQFRLAVQNQVHRNLKNAGDFYGVFVQLWKQKGGG